MLLDSDNDQAHLDPSHFTLGTTAGTIAAGNDPRLVAVVTPKMFGAVEDGVTDDTAAIQQAINAASVMQGCVELGAQHCIAGNVTSFGVAIYGRNYTAAKHVQTNSGSSNQPLTNGTVLNLTGGVGGSATATAAITLQENASLQGVTIFYPNQLASAATPTAYPYAVRIVSTATGTPNVSTGGQVVRDVELLNAYRGIECLCGSARIENVTGTPLAMGIHCDGAPDTIWISHVEFNPWWNYGSASASWVRSYGTAFDVGRVDELMMDHCLAFFYQLGLRTFNSVDTRTPFQGGGYGTLDCCSFDTCTTPVRIEGGIALGWELNSCKYAPNNATVGVGIGVDVAASAVVHVALNGGRFWGPLDTAIRVQGSGDLLVQGVKFACTSAGSHINITSSQCVGRIDGNIAGLA